MDPCNTITQNSWFNRLRERQDRFGLEVISDYLPANGGGHLKLKGSCEGPFQPQIIAPRDWGLSPKSSRQGWVSPSRGKAGPRAKVRWLMVRALDESQSSHSHCDTGRATPPPLPQFTHLPNREATLFSRPFWFWKSDLFLGFLPHLLPPGGQPTNKYL